MSTLKPPAGLRILPDPNSQPETGYTSIRDRLAIICLAQALTAALSATAASAQQEPEFVGEKTTVVVFPRGDYYPPHIAGPDQRGSAATISWVARTTAPVSGDQAFGLKLGGRFGILRFQRTDRPDLGWQIGIDAGWYGQFDIDQNWDNLGWDGFFGLAFSSSLGSKAALEVGAFHTSGHLGDEYVVSTGRERLGYTRTELRVGLDWSFSRRWRTYGQFAYGYGRDNPVLQKPWRVQGGLEYEANNSIWGKRFGWYAAADVNLSEERDWHPDAAVAVGLNAWTGARRWRLGLEYYDGRVPLGEFFFEDQRHISFGLYLDINARRPE